MTDIAAEIMQKLYGTDIYAGFVPTFPLDLQGWNSEHPALREAIAETQARIVIDVGVWKGGSAAFMARCMRGLNLPGVVIGVDTFLGSVEHNWPGSPFSGLIPRQFGRPLLYEQFLSNMVRAQLQDMIVPVPNASDTGALLLQRLGIRANVIHIDACHDYPAALLDARAYWGLLAPGGYLVGDDYSEIFPGVVRSADEFVREVGLPLEVRAPKWVVRKPG